MGGYLGYDEQTWVEAAEHEYEDRAERARELDDRPDAALANIARDIEAEARPAVEDLMVERYGRRVGGP